MSKKHDYVTKSGLIAFFFSIVASFLLSMICRSLWEVMKLFPQERPEGWLLAGCGVVFTIFAVCFLGILGFIIYGFFSLLGDD